MEVTLGRGALAEVDDGAVLAAAVGVALYCVSDACCLGDLCG